MTRIPLSDFLGGGAAVAPAPKRMKLDDFLSGGAAPPVASAPAPLSVPFANQPTQTDPLSALLSGGAVDPDWTVPRGPTGPGIDPYSQNPSDFMQSRYEPAQSAPSGAIPEVEDFLGGYDPGALPDPSALTIDGQQLPLAAISPSIPAKPTEPGIDEYTAIYQDIASRQPVAESDEEAYQRNLRLAAQMDQANRGAITGNSAYRLGEDIVTAGASAIVNPLLAAEAKLGIDGADEMLQRRQADRDISHMRDMSWAERTAGGVGESIAQFGTLALTGGGVSSAIGLGGKAAAAAKWGTIGGGLGQQSYSQAYREAINSGKTEDEATKIATATAALEVGVMGAFQAVGLGGAERAIASGLGVNAAKGAASKTSLQGIKTFLKQTAGELTEEEITTLTQNLAQLGDAGSGMDYLNTAVQTIATMGLLAGSQKIVNFIADPTKEKAAALGLDKVYTDDQLADVASSVASTVYGPSEQGKELTDFDPPQTGQDQAGADFAKQAWDEVDAEFELQPGTEPVAPEPIQAEIPPPKKTIGRRIEEGVAQRKAEMASPVAEPPRKRRLGDKNTATPEFQPSIESATIAPAPVKPLTRMEQKARENLLKENDLIRQGKKRDIPGATDGQAWVINTWKARRPAGVDTPQQAAQWIEGGGYGIAPYWKYLEREGITLEEAFARVDQAPTPLVAPPDAPPVAPSQAPADSGVAKETGYIKGDQVEYTGTITDDGLREFVYMEGAKKGQTGVTWTEAEKQARVEQNQRAWQQQQDDFRKLREPDQIVDANKMAPEVVAPTVVEAPKKTLGKKTEERPVFYTQETRGQGQQYHGTSATALSPTNDHYSTLNYYGQGFYTTDAMDVAYGYSKRGSKESGKRGVWKIEEKRPLNIYNAEQPISPEIRAMLDDVAESQGILGDSIDQKPANLRELYDDFRDYSRDNGLSADTVQETFDTLAYRLQQMGYDGIEHKGGLRTDTKAHTVKIYFNPEEDISVSEVVPAEPLPLPSIEQAERATGKKTIGRKKAEPAKEESLPDWVTEDDTATTPTIDKKQRTELGKVKRRLKQKLDPEVFSELDRLSERDQHVVASEADRRSDVQNQIWHDVLEDLKNLQGASKAISLITRNKERSGKDASKIPGFDELVQQLRDGNLPALAYYASSRGQGDLEAGLFDILQGGKKGIEANIVGPEAHAYDVLEEYRERLEQAPEEDGGGFGPEASGEGLVDEQGRGGSAEGNAPAQEAEDFQLTGEGSTDTTPIVEPYKVAEKDRLPPKRKTDRQPQLDGLPEDLDESVLAGQQGLFSGKASDASSEELKPKKKLGRKESTTTELKGAAQNASLPALKPKTKNQPKTAEGKKLFAKLQADEGKNRVGLRTINDYLMELAHTKLFIGNTQTSKRNPAHYLGKVNSKGRPTGFGPHIIRSRTGYSHLNVHEAGHAISGYLGSLDPRWHKSIAGDLVKLTRMKGSVASANTPEEGWAELVRRYVVLPNSVPKNLYAEFEKTMDKYNPEMLAGLQDAQAAYAYHRSRDVMDQLQSLMYDKGKEKGIGGVIKDQIYRLMFSTIGGDVVLHRINRRGWRGIGGDNAYTGYDPTGLVSKGRSMIDEAYRERQKLADGFYKQIKDTPADMESAYQSWLHVPEESGRAIIGDKRGREGIRVRATGKGLDMLDEESVDKLREAGFYIPDAKAKHGDWIYLSDKSFDSIKSAVGKENWQAFETWGQMRAALDRFKKAGHDYPLKGDGLTPELLEQFVKEHQEANPDWDKHFRDVNNYMDQLLLVPVLSGEISVGDAINIKSKWSDYWPLPRQVEGKGVKAGGGGAEPSAGIRAAYGSLLPFRTLTEAVESRVKSAMEAYYTNRMMLSVKNYGDMLDSFNRNMVDPEATSKEDKNPLASFDARKEAMQLMLPLKMEMKVAAKLTEREQQEIVAKSMNKMAAEELGIAVSELDEETAIQPEDVVISTPGKAVWRSTKPKAAHVVRVFENGSPKYYQVPDPLLFDFFAHGQKSPNAYFRTAGILLRGVAAPWKRAITQSIPFALNNAIARDPFTAASLSKADSNWSLMPGYFMTVGVANRLTGGNLDAVSQSELLSRSLDQTSSKPHLTRWENFKEMLAEGIVPPNYSDMPWYDKAAAAPGQLMSTVLKPADVFNYVTAGRALSKLGEEATREGAYVTALREGASDERAQLAYDQISGNFGQRGGNPEAAELIRSAGFLNPALQILWGSAQHPTHYNPAMRARYIVAKMPAIASLSAVAAAVNVLLIKAMHDEDDAKEIFAQMQERKDEDRLSKMAVGGMVALPFDYGHVGAVQSYAWNAVEGWMLDDPVDPTVRAKELLHRATTMPGVADTIPPHVKLWIELGAGETGHSFFYNDDIVPAWLVDKYKNNPELRAYPETPTAYKKVGEWLGVSPMKVRYAVTSGLSREMDAALTTVERPNKDVSDIVVAGRLATKESTGFNSDSVASLLELDYEYTQLKERAENETDPAKKAELEAKVAGMETTHMGATLVEKVWQAAKEMRENGDTAGYKKSKRIMVGMGRDILGAPPLKGFPDPWRDWGDMPPEIQESITKYVTLRAEESLKSRGYPQRKKDDDGNYEETDAEFQARMKAFQSKQSRSIDWLKNHKKATVVQSAISEVAKDIPAYPILRGDNDFTYGKRVAEWRAKYGKSAELVKALK